MMDAMGNHAEWTPYAFAFLIGLSMLLYATLDGYDLGVGILSRRVSEDERERMIASIGPFWDANETWLVLGVGLLLVAFPVAHGIVLSALYLPVGLMIIALIFRGVSFDFRKKVAPAKQPKWNHIFFWSSLVVALSQGYMVGRFVTGLQGGWSSQIFALFFGLLVVAGYILMGATWLILKSEGDLQKKALRWARQAVWVMVLGAILSSVAVAFADERIFDRLFSFPEITLLSAMPIIAVVLTLLMHFICGVMPLPEDRLAWMPFGISVFIFALGFIGLVYSFYPYIIPGKLRITEAAAAPESLLIILVGTLVVLPFLVGYTILAYYIFRGKAGELRYD
jgi:cytochrome bd ubiquinol oxidase subunit II